MHTTGDTTPAPTAKLVQRRNLRLTAATSRRVDEVARALGWSPSQVVRELVAAGLDRLEARADRVRSVD